MPFPDSFSCPKKRYYTNLNLNKKLIMVFNSRSMLWPDCALKAERQVEEQVRDKYRTKPY